MDNETPIEKLLERAENYGKTTIELAKLNAIDKTSEMISSLASRLAVFMVIALLAIIVNIGLSLWVGDILGKNYYGFFVVSGFYVIVAILIHACRESWIKHPVQNSIIAQMLKEKSYGK